jgi:hypothetical protein
MVPPGKLRIREPEFMLPTILLEKFKVSAFGPSKRPDAEFDRLVLADFEKMTDSAEMVFETKPADEVSTFRIRFPDGKTRRVVVATIHAVGLIGFNQFKKIEFCFPGESARIETT